MKKDRQGKKRGKERLAGEERQTGKMRGKERQTGEERAKEADREKRERLTGADRVQER